MADEGFSGMAALIRGLGALGEHVKAEAGGIVRSTAQLLQARVRQRYARRTGTLQDRVMVEQLTELRWKVRSKAPHAHLYEQGTVERFTRSAGASRGRMPAKPVFVPDAVVARARMKSELMGLLVRQTVPGMTGRLDVRES